MNIFRNNRHVYVIEAVIFGKSFECLEGGNWSVDNCRDVIEEVEIFDIVDFDVPETLDQILCFNLVDAIVIAESKRRYRAVPLSVI